jgi:predicted nucleic acid-binding protein
VIAYVNANIAIYVVEQNPTWGPKATARIQQLRSQGDSLAISDLSRLECMVGPLKKGDMQLLAIYQQFFSQPDVQVLPLLPSVCDRAARIRATYGFPTVDSLHLAAAIEHGCGLFLTLDLRLRRCTDITVEILS